MRTRQFEASRGRKRGIVIFDPLDKIVYRRVRSGRFLETPSLQELYQVKGFEALRRFAGLNYQGFSVGVVVWAATLFFDWRGQALVQAIFCIACRSGIITSRIAHRRCSVTAMTRGMGGGSRGFMLMVKALGGAMLAAVLIVALLSMANKPLSTKEVEQLAEDLEWAGKTFDNSHLATVVPAAEQIQKSVPQTQAAVSNRAMIQPGLTIRDHARKHNGEAEHIYQLLLEGKCVGSMTWCGGSDIEQLHICTDPVTGIVGAVLQYGNEITTGFYERPTSNYWLKRVKREDWGICQ